jgi:cytochrome c biogenesis protein ResB
MAMAVRRSYYDRGGAQIADNIAQRLMEAQSVEVGGKKYTFALRPTRAYEPYSMTLLKTTHSVYAGTETPKDFRSRVRLNHPAKGEDREVEIYMNNPLRYQGLTFYQHQMTGEQLAARWGETPSSVLQVVRNPSWLTPYAGCLIVAGGLIIQFMIHLVGFISRRKA